MLEMHVLYSLLILLMLNVVIVMGSEELQESTCKIIYTMESKVTYLSNERNQSNRINIGKEYDGIPWGVTYDSRNEVAYWTDLEGIIVRSNLRDASSIETFLETGIKDPEGIAFDWITGNIYFVDNTLQRITACNNLSKNCSIILQSLKGKPRDIVLHPTLGIMFWTQNFMEGNKSAVMRAGMDGIDLFEIFSGNILLYGIALDYEQSKVFWATRKGNTIESSNFDGGNHRVFMGGPGFPDFYPDLIDVGKKRLYWTSFGTDSHLIKSADKFNGTDVKVVIREIDEIIAVIIVKEDTQLTLRPNPCKVADCPHLCTLSADLSCSCFSSISSRMYSPPWKAKVQTGNDTNFDDTTETQDTSESKPDPQQIQTGVAIAGFVLLGVLATVIIALLAYKIHLSHRKLPVLTDKEMSEFQNGRAPPDGASSNSEDNDYHIFLEGYNQSLYEIGKFEFCKEMSTIVGSGTFGVVYKSFMPRFQCEVAVKRPKCTSSFLGDNSRFKNEVWSVLCEIKIMSFVGEHPNVLKLLGAYTQEIQSGNVLVITELCENGSLRDYLAQLKPEVRNNKVNVFYRFCEEIATGMDYLAQKNVIHGDLSARNVLLDKQMKCKISDFGLARKLGRYKIYKKKTEELLPWAWMALESLSRMEFSLKSDIWAMGVTYWEIFSGRVPYPLERGDEEFIQKLNDGLRLNQPQLCTDEVFDNISQCWHKDADSRPDANHFAQFFQRQRTMCQQPCQMPKVHKRTLANPSVQQI